MKNFKTAINLVWIYFFFHLSLFCDLKIMLLKFFGPSFYNVKMCNLCILETRLLGHIKWRVPYLVLTHVALKKFTTIRKYTNKCLNEPPSGSGCQWTFGSCTTYWLADCCSCAGWSVLRDAQLLSRIFRGLKKIGTNPSIKVKFLN